MRMALRRPSPNTAERKVKNLKIVESIAGTWFYHLGTIERTKCGQKVKSLCGASVMQTSIPLDYWGIKADHIPETYCKECGDIYSEVKNDH